MQKGKYKYQASNKETYLAITAFRDRLLGTIEVYQATFKIESLITKQELPVKPSVSTKLKKNCANKPRIGVQYST